MKRSLKGRLRWLAGLILAAVLIPLAILGYRRALQEMNELADGRLAQAARTVDTLVESSGIGQALRNAALPRHSGQHGTLVVPVLGPDCTVQGASCEPEVGFQIADASGMVLAETKNVRGLPPPSRAEPGFRDLTLRGERWRAYTVAASANGDLIQVAERYDSRDETVQMLRFEHGLSLLIGLPLLVLLMGWAVQRGLRPLDVLEEKLTQRLPGSREPVELDDAPSELEAVLGALNDLLNRSEDAMEREHQFAADVAHELRTPLAGAMIHLQNASAEGPPTVGASIASARTGLENLARRIERLLALARLETGASADQERTVDLVELAYDVIEELAPLLASRDADLSLICDLSQAQGAPEHYVLKGHAVALGALFRNLIENALRHIPAKGIITVRLSRGDGGLVYLDVIDNGPGIPASRREAVFTRFHREPQSKTDGHGLGLSIVMRAAELHHATVELLDPPSGSGLQVRVTFPAREADATS